MLPRRRPDNNKMLFKDSKPPVGAGPSSLPMLISLLGSSLYVAMGFDSQTDTEEVPGSHILYHWSTRLK